MGAIPRPLQRYRLLRRRASSGLTAPVPLLYSAVLLYDGRLQGGDGVAARQGAGLRPPRYLFGDSDVASHRLRVLSEVFVESSRRFLRAAAPDRPGLAVDVGCGPGYTTRLVADVLRPRRMVGIDRSEAFITEARRTGGSNVSYLVHDAAAVPFPVGPADLIYARFVATHLSDPTTTIRGWATQLVPGGLLLLDETDSISTTNRGAVTLPDYLDRTARPPGQSPVRRPDSEQHLRSGPTEE